MSNSSAPIRCLPLVTLLSASALLGACSSSGDGDALPPNDATNGDTVTLPGETPDTGTGTPPTDMGETPDTGTGTPPTDMGETPDTGTDTPTLVTGGVFGPVVGRTTDIGLVQIEQPTAGDGGSAFAGFFRTDLPIPVGDAITSLVPPLDTCTVTRSEAEEIELPTDGDGFGGFDFPFEFQSAGETITFTSPAGTWLTLPRLEALGLVAYSSDDALPLPVPSGLVVDIPGDVFPAFANVPVPDVTPLVGTSPAGTPASADTTFRWQAGSGDPSVFVQISISTGGGAGLLDGLPDDFLDSLPEGGIPGLGGGGPSVTLDCVVRDDGEFALPATTRAELGADFSGVPEYSRLGTAAVQNGDVLLLVLNESSAD